MTNTSKGIAPDRLVGTFGSKYLNATNNGDGAGVHAAVNAYAFVVQEDTVLSLVKGGDASTAVDTYDYLVSISLTGVTLKQGALIQAPAGELFQLITITSGSLIVYK
jgi:hypothetical protein